MRVIRDLVGTILSGRYRLIARLAGGGMGEVYRGHDLLLDRPVAVKILEPSLATDPELVSRFKAEARAAARLTHPRVVGVYDWGSQDELTYYMVMEYVSGTDLRDLMVARGPLEPSQTIEVMASVCDALGAAHERGLVHRDVKPENILISRAGEVKVADFGIAVITDGHRTAPGGTVPGTLRYLSPEQAAGRDASPASDIWAAGAVLFELLTDALSLQGAGAELLQRRAVEHPRPPSEIDRSIPAELDRIVLRACALDPAERFATAGEMAEALRRAERHVPPSAGVARLLDDVTGEIRLPDMDVTSFLETPSPRRRGRARRWLRASVMLVVAVATVVAAAVAAPALFGPRAVEVPDLVGMTSEEAARTAQSLGLDIVVTGRFHQVNIPRGEVVTQDPRGGTLEEGRLIAVTVSAGPPLREVPNVTGVPLETARVRLRAAGLDAGRIVTRHDDADEGTVIGQRPRRGELEWGSKVRLVVSEGPKPVAVPDVVGMALDKARSSLEQAGFSVAIVEAFSDEVPAGRVVSTEPAAASAAPEGSRISVVVSKGPRYKKLKMPDVRNTHVSEARAKLESLQLRVRVVQSSGGGGTVVSETDPIAGTTIRQNDLVALFVC